MLSGNVSFLKESFNAVGGFNEIYTSWGMEDVDLGYKFFKHKSRFVFSSKTKGVHYPHERDNAVKFTSNTNNKYLFYENYRTIETKLYIIANILSFNTFLDVFIFTTNSLGRHLEIFFSKNP
jgi:predicted glycosyltransferase involved in capsule biosynthesis